MPLAHTRPTFPQVVPRGRGQFTSCLQGSSMLLITAEGDVDITNARELAEFAGASLDGVEHLILDLRSLNFFGVQGFSALHRLNVTCSRIGVNWVIVPGDEVTRLLRICDPAGHLPAAPTLETAIAAVVRPPRSHLRVIEPL